MSAISTPEDKDGNISISFQQAVRLAKQSQSCLNDKNCRKSIKKSAYYINYLSYFFATVGLSMVILGILMNTSPSLTNKTAMATLGVPISYWVALAFGLLCTVGYFAFVAYAFCSANSRMVVSLAAVFSAFAAAATISISGQTFGLYNFSHANELFVSLWSAALLAMLILIYLNKTRYTGKGKLCNPIHNDAIDGIPSKLNVTSNTNY